MLNPSHRDSLRAMAALPPAIAASADVSDRSFVSIDRTPIRHRAYQHCEQVIAALHLRHIEEGTGGCVLLVGPSGAGKSLLQTSYQDKYTSALPDPELQVFTPTHVLRASVPSKPTVKSVVTELLHAAKHPSYAANESEALKTIRLLQHMKDHQTQVVFLDEMTNLHDQANQNVEYEMTDWLKNFGDSSGCVFVLAGLKRVDSLLRRNNQLRRRIQSKVVMSELSMSSPENWTEFRYVLRELHRRAPVKAVCFDEQILARRFYIASAGLMDYLFRIVDAAANVAFSSGKPIDVSTLASAFVEKVWFDCPDGLNPFLIRDPDELRMLTEPGEPFADWDL